MYIEYVLADNFVLDTLLLFLSALTLRIPFKKYRIVLGGAVGATCAVVSVYIDGFWTYPFKVAMLVAMCILSVGWGKKLFWHILLTVAYTFLLGGAVTGLFNLLKIDYVNGDGQFYQMRVPLFVYVLAVATTVFLCYSIVTYIRQVKKIAPFLVKATVTLDKPYTVKAFCDSGNTLACKGLPVCFVTKKFDGFSAYFAKQMLSGRAEQVDVTTVAGTVSVSAVPAEVEVSGTKLKVYLALPRDKCNTVYNIILSNEFMGGSNENA